MASEDARLDPAFEHGLEVLRAVRRLPGVGEAWFHHRETELPPSLAVEPDRLLDVRALHTGLLEAGLQHCIQNGYGVFRGDANADIALVVALEDGALPRTLTEQLGFFAALAGQLVEALPSEASRAAPSPVAPAAEPLLPTLLEAFPFGAVVVLDREGIVLARGGHSLRRHAPSFDLSVGDRFLERVELADRDTLEAELQAAFEGRHELVETQFGGDWYLTEVGPLRDPAGRVVAAYRWSQHVGRRRALEAELERSDTLLAEAMRAGQLGSLRLDIESSQLTWSEEAAAIHGFTSVPEHLEGLFAALPEVQAERLKEELERLLREGGQMDLNYPLEGGARWVRMSGRCFEGQRRRVTAIVQDVTEQVHQQQANFFQAQELEAAKVKAEAGERAKSEFLAVMSHELRTPLNGIIASAHLLAEGHLTASEYELVEMVRRSGEDLIGYIDDLLELSSSESGEVRAPPRCFDLHSVLSKTVDTFRPQADEKGIALELELEPGLEPNRIGDPNRLRRAVAKLVSNAVKFTEQGGVEVRLSASGEDGVRLEVRDTGIGISQDRLELLFDPFEMRDASRKRSFGGLGLGLVILKRMVEGLGGEVEVQSEPGVGSSFCFEVPLPFGRTCDGAVMVAPGPLRVLVAEDNPVNQRVIVRMLQRLGHRAVVAENGQEAVQHFESDRFDLVLMDLQMPVMDGIEATRAIRSLEKGLGHRCPVWALTANALDSDRIACLEAGMDRFLTKPIRLDKLRELLTPS